MKEWGGEAMILYHGSNLAIPKPDILHSRPYVDFVVKCRSGQDKSDYDIVIGGIANDLIQ